MKNKKPPLPPEPRIIKESGNKTYFVEIIIMSLVLTIITFLFLK